MGQQGIDLSVRSILPFLIPVHIYMLRQKLARTIIYARAADQPGVHKINFLRMPDNGPYTLKSLLVDLPTSPKRVLLVVSDPIGWILAHQIVPVNEVDIGFAIVGPIMFPRAGCSNGPHLPVGESVKTWVIFTIKIRTIDTTAGLRIIIDDRQMRIDLIPFPQFMIGSEGKCEFVKITVFPITIGPVSIIAAGKYARFTH